MKTLNAIIAITIMSFLFLSCSNDGDGSESTKPIYLLTKTPYASGSGYGAYQYDANNRLTVAESINPGFTNYKTTFFYNSNGKIEETLELHSGGAFPGANVKTTYTYDTQNRLVEKKYFEQSTPTYDYVRSYLFEYIGNSVILKIVTKGSAFPSNKYVIDYDNKGNMSKYTSYDNIDANNPNGFISFSMSYTYDDKFNFSTSLPFEYDFPFVSVNNPLKAIRTTSSGTTSTTDYVYEYNVDGYPTKRTVNGQISSYEYLKL